MKYPLKYLILTATFALAACALDITPVPTPEPAVPAADGKVRIELSTSAPDYSTPTTRAGSADEDTIGQTPWVLVFGDGGYVEAARGYVQGGSRYVELTASEGPRQLLVLANPQAKFTTANATTEYDFSTANLDRWLAGKSLTEAAALLHTQQLTSPQQNVPFTGGALPMSGVASVEKIGAGQQVAVTMVRTTARVTVENSAEDFTLAGATLTGAPCRSTLHRAGDATTIEANTARTDYSEIVSATDNTTAANPIYLYESPADGGTFLIVEGTYKGQTNYYKLAFTGTSGEALDIVRNYHYRVQITSVEEAGHATLAAAKAASASNISATVTVTDPTAHDIVDNGRYYLGVSNSQYIVYGTGALSNKVAFTVTTDCTETGLTNSITVSGTGLSLVGTGAQTITLASGTSQVGTRDVQINMTQGFQSGTVTLRLGDLVKTVSITRGGSTLPWRSTTSGQAENAQLTLPFTGDYLSAQVTGGEDWLGVTTTNDRTAPRSSYLHTEAGEGNIYIHARPNYSSQARSGGVVYLSRRNEKDGRTKLDISQQQGEELALAVNKDAIEFAYFGSDDNFRVTTSRLGNTNLPCTVEFSLDGGKTWITTELPLSPVDMPVNVASEVPVGSLNIDIGIAMHALPAAIPWTPENDKLKNSPDATGGADEASAVDLSTRFGSRNTANCYIINGPGWYSLPLVYGNAIKNGSTNTSAYTSTASGGNIMSPLVNHDGQRITDPYITNNNNVNVNNAVLVWAASDSESADDKYGTDSATGGRPANLVTGVGLHTYGSEQRLVFNIPQASIRQGNAVVAVRNQGGTILWSWHLWITPLVDANPANTATYTTKNDTGIFYDFMEYNLGFVRGPSTRYGFGLDGNPEPYNQPRPPIILRITQDIEDGLEHDITLTQLPGVFEPASINTFYQWGRKDPMIPSNGKPAEGTKNSAGVIPTASVTNHHDTKPVYWGQRSQGQSFGADGTGANPSGGMNINIPRTSGGSVQLGIQNPHLFYMGSNGVSGSYSNLWSINETDSNTDANLPDGSGNDRAVVKTVYDPNPVGFKMPASNTWTRFALERRNTSGTPWHEPNLWDKGAGWIDPEWNSGYWFYLTADKQGDYTVQSFPASGGRHYNTGALDFVDMRGHNWSALRGRYLYIFYQNNDGNGPGISPVRNSEIGRGFSVRGVRE